MDSRAQAEQIRSVSVERLGPALGRVPAPLMALVDDALRLHLSSDRLACRQAQLAAKGRASTCDDVDVVGTVLSAPIGHSSSPHAVEAPVARLDRRTAESRSTNKRAEGPERWGTR